MSDIKALVSAVGSSEPAVIVFLSSSFCLDIRNKIRAVVVIFSRQMSVCGHIDLSDCSYVRMCVCIFYSFMAVSP